MDKNIIKSHLFVEKLNYRSISGLIVDHLNRDCDNNFLIDCTSGLRKWTKRQVLDSSLNFAYYLINDCKLCKGDIVLYVGHNTDIMAVAILAVYMAGGVFCGLPGDSTHFEIEANYRRIRPSFIVCSELEYKFMTTMSNISVIKRILFFGQTVSNENQYLCIENIIQKSHRTANICLPVQTDSADIALLVMTSGSTGVPKAVINTHGNLLAAQACMQHKQIFNIQPNDILMATQFAYMDGQHVLLAAIVGGAQLAIVPLASSLETTGQGDEHLFYKNVHKCQITHLWMAPTALNHLCHNYDKLKCYIKSVRNVLATLAPLSATTYKAVVDKYAFDVFRNSYGLTEMNWAIQVPISEAKQLSNYETIGKVCPNTEIKIIDEMGQSLPCNTRGEICIRSEQVTPGYLNNSVETAQLFTADGFLRSGDIGYYDELQYFYIVGRIKNIIKVKGVQIAPAELEHLLIAHPSVVNAAVIGAPDEEWGQMPRAFVTVVRDVSVDDQELIDYVNTRVSYYKRLRGGLRILDTFPMTATGKIDMESLKEYP